MADKFLNRKYGCNFIIVVLIVLSGSNVAGQNKSVGIRFTPNVISKPMVSNPSEAHIYGELRLAFDAGIDFTRMFNKSWGLSTGLDIGVVDWNYVIEDPLNAFGSKQGYGNFSTDFNSDNYFYNALSLHSVYKTGTSGNQFRISAGPSIRLYHSQNEEARYSSIINRTTPWDSDDPNAGPPDVQFVFPPNSWQWNFALVIGMERRVSDRANLVLGLRKNWGLNPISDGSLMVQMNDNIYNGAFATTSNYIGLDLQYRFMGKPFGRIERTVPMPSYRSGFRKSVFIEALGNGVVGSMNYDMRITRFRNDGLGFRAGLGLGEYILDDRAEFNRAISIPLTINHILGKQRHGFETGIGITPQITLSRVDRTGQKIESVGFVNIGYRYQPLREGVLARITWTPMIVNGFDPSWLGVSVGFSFQ